MPAVLSGEHLEACRVALIDKTLVYADEYLVAYCDSNTSCGSLLYLSGLPKRLTDGQKTLVEMFSKNVQIAFDNIMLTKDIEDTQREVIERLSQSTEGNEINEHYIFRTVKACRILGKALGLDDIQLNLLTSAAPLHNVGNLCSPTRALYKQDILSPEDVQLIERHTEFGYQLLKGSNRPLIKVAAIIAKEHHEYWNGQGYPDGLQGENIHLYSRIVAVAVAYTILRSDTAENQAWSVQKTLEHMQARSASQFDPNIVAMLTDNIGKIEDDTLDWVR